MPLVSGQIITPATAPGRVGSSLRTTPVTITGGTTPVETVVQSFTFTAVPTALYQITALQSVQSSVVGDDILVRIRWQAGATLTTAGAELTDQLPNADIANNGAQVSLSADLTGVTGQVTVGVTVARDLGTGSLIAHGSSKVVNQIIVNRV